MKRKWRHIAFVLTLVGATTLIVAGYVSNAIAKSLCLQRVAADVQKPIGWRFFYLRNPDQDDEVQEAFDLIGAEYELLIHGDPRIRTWPRITMKGKTFIPFFVSMDYFWEREAEIGDGATKWFFCLFGNVIEIGETNTKAS